MLVGMNPYQIAVGKPLAQKLEGKEIAILSSMAANILDTRLERLREQLLNEVRDLCKSAHETPLPPMRAVNHTIPLIDKERVYKWRPSRCPEAVRPFWNEKRDQYLKAGRWRFRAGRNTRPMMIVPKKDGS
jgi:hypothetical protein